MDNASYTILRIKRKRNEEPLDALVVESGSRRKRAHIKNRGGLDVFQYAQTVEGDTWDDASRRQALQKEIGRIAQENAIMPTPSASGPSEPSLPAPPSPIKYRQNTDDQARRYKIIEQAEAEYKAPTRPNSPPKIMSAKALAEAKKAAQFKMYDAVLSDITPVSKDPEMDKFMDMLTDYMKINDVPMNLSTDLHSGTDDYVWDVFYRRPVTSEEWAEMATRVGTLTGLPPSLRDPNESDSEPEEEDEADEDSNGCQIFAFVHTPDHLTTGLQMKVTTKMITQMRKSLLVVVTDSMKIPTTSMTALSKMRMRMVGDSISFFYFDFLSKRI